MILPNFASFARALILLGVGASGQLLRNITIDDTDPAITYTGPGWHVDPPYPGFYQGGHHWSSQYGAYATFTFTGVAVYYLAPLYSGYEDGVSTLISLDSGPAQWVNLTSVGLEPAWYAVRWSASGLANGMHTVINTLGSSALGELAMWAVVDGFIYSVQDSPTPPSTPPPSTPPYSDPSFNTHSY